MKVSEFDKTLYFLMVALMGKRTAPPITMEKDRQVSANNISLMEGMGKYFF
jgi:hypothetical protein